MSNTKQMAELTPDEKAKAAYALNLCAVSISQIIDSKDIVVLKQEREYILNNLNLQNFVKHPALLEAIRHTLDTITYLEIQAGDLSFVEKEYQQKLKNAIWSAVPSPGIILGGGHPVLMAFTALIHIGTGYMNYRRNKSQYGLEKERQEWELKRHEIEELYGLRAQLFETAWKLSEDYDFDDKYRLTETQLSKYSEALLEPDPVKRYEKLDVMSDIFEAFPPFWYYKGNAAAEVYREERFKEFSAGYKESALRAFREFYDRNKNFEFLREDIVAATCCLELISMLDPANDSIEELLADVIRYAGSNYDVLQQSIIVSLQQGKISEVVAPLREMIANDYNVGFNGFLLSRIYCVLGNNTEYNKLRYIVGKDRVYPWANDEQEAERLLLDFSKQRLAEGYRSMALGVIHKLVKGGLLMKVKSDAKDLTERFHAVSVSLLDGDGDVATLKDALMDAEDALEQAIDHPSKEENEKLLESCEKVCAELQQVDFESHPAGKLVEMIAGMETVSETHTDDEE